MRSAIEDTGAHFTNELEECTELYEGLGTSSRRLAVHLCACVSVCVA